MTIKYFCEKDPSPNLSVDHGVFFYDFQVKLAEFSKTSEDFLRKYEELKSKNVRNLDPLVYLLSKLCEDKEVIYHLKKNNYKASFITCKTILITFQR